MNVITNCYFGKTGTSVIDLMRKRSTCSMFVVSSFQKLHQKPLRRRHNLNRFCFETENRKSRFAIMALHASRMRGLFEIVEMVMKKAPKVGQRVSYHSEYLIKYEKEPRVCTGTVIRIYPHHDDLFNDDGEFIRRGPLMPEDQWNATVQVDRPLPKWWAYGEKDLFAPDVADLEAI